MGTRYIWSYATINLVSKTTTEILIPPLPSRYPQQAKERTILRKGSAIPSLLLHLEGLLCQVTWIRWEGPLLCPTQWNTIGPTRKRLPIQSQPGDREDLTESQSSNCSENQIGSFKDMSYWWPRKFWGRSKLQHFPRQESHHCVEVKELPTWCSISWPPPAPSLPLCATKDPFEKRICKTKVLNMIDKKL